MYNYQLDQTRKSVGGIRLRPLLGQVPVGLLLSFRCKGPHEMIHLNHGCKHCSLSIEHGCANRKTCILQFRGSKGMSLDPGCWSLHLKFRLLHHRFLFRIQRIVCFWFLMVCSMDDSNPSQFQTLEVLQWWKFHCMLWRRTCTVQCSTKDRSRCLCSNDHPGLLYPLCWHLLFLCCTQ